MKRTYIITSIQNGAYLATPEDQFEYGNKHQRSNIEVTNPNNYPLEVGSKVIIGLPKKHEAITGIISLLTPIAAAVTGYFISGPLSDLLKKQCTEIFKALTISGCFSIASAFILATTRSTPTIIKLQVNEVL